MSAEVKSMKEWALYYAELGLAVFPLAYRNKVPAIEGGCKAATTEKSKIERWWNQNPRYNIGIATGNKSNGLVVIDLDVDKNKGIDGYEVLRDWQNKHGELPETWQSITGRGGYHYFYKDTITHSNKVGLYEGVDIRGEGGYIVAPPSVHPNGNTYEWEQEPKEYEIAQVDDIVNDFFKGEKQRIDSEHKTNFKVPELIPEGKRVKAQSSHLEASSLQCWATRNRVTTSRRRKLCSERSSGKKQQDDRQAVEVTGLQLRSTAGHCLTR